MKKLKRLTPIYIEFDDHATARSSWTLEQHCCHSICYCHAIGYVAKDGENYLTIAKMHNDNQDVTAEHFTIVKSCIRKLKVLRGIK